MMHRSMLFMALLVALAVSVSAGALENFPMKRGYLQWMWDGTSDPQATGFVLDCGKTSGSYTISKAYPVTQFEVAMRDVLPTPGPWYCTITALYGTARGGASAEFPFGLVGDLILKGVTK